MKLSFKNILSILLVFTLLILLTGCFTTPSPTYTVTYNGNVNTGGVVPTDTKLYEEGVSVTVLGNTGILVKTGYTFDGWNTAADGNGTDRAVGSTFTMGTANVTLYAKWTESPGATPTTPGPGPTPAVVNFTLTMLPVPVEGVLLLTGAGTYSSGATATIIATAKNCYEFVNWTGDTVADANSANTTIVMSSNKSVTANFKLSENAAPEITSVTLDGVAITGTLDLTVGVPFEICVNATDVSAILTYWFSDTPGGEPLEGTTKETEGCSGVIILPAETVAATYENIYGNVSDGCLTTSWGPITIIIHPAPTYTVTYDGNTNTGGTVPTDPNSPYPEGASVTVLGNSGSLIKHMSNPNSHDHIFAGWNTAADGSGNSGTDYIAGNTFAMGTADVILYAQYSHPYTVTYDDHNSDSGTVPVDSLSPYVQGASVTVLGNPGSLVRSGHTFGGWNTEDDGNGTNYLEGNTFVMGTSNVTLYPRWLHSYTVTYDGNGATGGTAPVDGSSPYLEDTLVTVLGNSGSLVRTGYTFDGWNTAANLSGTHYAAGDTFTITNNRTLYAQWGPYTLTIIQDSDGVVTPSSAGPYAYGTVVTLTCDPNNGKHWNGWDSSSNSGDPVWVSGTSDNNINWVFTITMDGNKNLDANFH